MTREQRVTTLRSHLLAVVEHLMRTGRVSVREDGVEMDPSPELGRYLAAALAHTLILDIRDVEVDTSEEALELVHQSLSTPVTDNYVVVFGVGAVDTLVESVYAAYLEVLTFEALPLAG